MSEKTVKITDGKILNYTITAGGYKPVKGNDLILDNKNITLNLAPKISEKGVYSIGDRLNNIATFLCYFNSEDPDTNISHKYAVFVLDAAYRFLSVISTVHAEYYGWARSPNLPYYDTAEQALLATESATWNTNTVLNDTSTANTFPAFVSARSVASIEINGNTYQSQFPNIYELYQIWKCRKILDASDPTLSLNTKFSLEAWNFFSSSYCTTCSSTVSGVTGAFGVNSSGTISKNAPGYGATLESQFCIMPVFEIPVN